MHHPDNPYTPAPMTEPMSPWWLSFFRRRQPHGVEPQRLLDDVAYSVHQTRVQLILSEQSGWKFFRPRIKRRIVRSLLLDDQFFPFTSERYWGLLWKFIGCPSPSRTEGESIQRVVDHVMEMGLVGQRVPAGHVTIAHWVNAQIFAGVQQITVEQCGVDKHSVYRGARFLEDIGCC